MKEINEPEIENFRILKPGLRSYKYISHSKTPVDSIPFVGTAGRSIILGLICIEQKIKLYSFNPCELKHGLRGLKILEILPCIDVYSLVDCLVISEIRQSPINGFRHSFNRLANDNSVDMLTALVREFYYPRTNTL